MAAIPMPADLPVERDLRDELFGHPKGVYVCFFTEMWERFSFYGMKALLLLYLLQHHRFGDKSGYDVLGAYGGLVYCLPVIGGVLADRWLGMRKAVIFGGLLLVCGHAGMAIEGHAAHHRQRRGHARRRRAADLLPVACADHHGRRVPQAEHLDHRRQALSRKRSAPRFGLLAVLCRHQPRRAVRIDRLRLPRPDAGLELRLRRGGHRHAVRAGAVPVGTEIPARPRRIACAGQVARTRRWASRANGRSISARSPDCCRSHG